jgi:hypothetical protein
MTRNRCTGLRRPASRAWQNISQRKWSSSRAVRRHSKRTRSRRPHACPSSQTSRVYATSTTSTTTDSTSLTRRLLMWSRSVPPLRVSMSKKLLNSHKGISSSGGLSLVGHSEVLCLGRRCVSVLSYMHECISYIHQCISYILELLVGHSEVLCFGRRCVSVLW